MKLLIDRVRWELPCNGQVEKALKNTIATFVAYKATRFKDIALDEVEKYQEFGEEWE